MTVLAALRNCFAENRRPLALATGVLTVGATVGVSVALLGPTPADSGGAPTASAAAETLAFPRLLVTNGTVGALLVGGGALLALPTLLTLFRNGLVVGALAGAAARGGDGVVFLALLAPHGLVELGAFCIAGAAGLRLPLQLTAYLRGHRETVATRSELRQVGLLAVTAAVLIVVAAAIESSVTHWLARELA